MPTRTQCLFIIPIIGAYPHPADPESPTPEEQTLIDAWQARFDNSTAIYNKTLRNYERVIVSAHSYTTLFLPDVGVVVSHPASPGVNGIANWFPTAWLARPSESATIARKANWFNNKIADFRANGLEIRGAACELATSWLASHNYSVVVDGAL